MTTQSAEYYKYIGLETLNRMAEVDRYNLWIYKKISPYVGRRILEVGCGIGSMAGMFLNRELIVTVDVLPEAVEASAQRYAEYPHMHPLVGNILNEDFVAEIKKYQVDTVMCLNVLEHIDQDEKALAHMSEILCDTGRLVLFVPAGMYLYGTLDRALGHHRRYEAKTLRPLVQKANFEIEVLEYCNLAGIIGWWLNSRILKRDLLSVGQLKLFNQLAPFFFGMEDTLSRMVSLPVGQSLVCIAKKEGH
jgi:SAM-dependent methyltransferase